MGKYFFTKEVIAPICIITFSFLLYKLLKSIIKKMFLLRKNEKNERKYLTIQSLVINGIKYFIFIIAILLLLEVYGIDTKSIIASLGVVGIILGLALQDLLKDFIAGLAILFENQYAVGDNVTIGDFRGDVQSIGMKTTKLKSYTGEIKIISNRNITEVVNHSLSSSRAIVDFGVAYETDLKKLEKVLEDLCKSLTATLPYLKGEVEVVGITKLNSSSIDYRLTVLTVPMEHYQVERMIKRELLDTLKKNKITIPYDQVVVHHE